MRMAGGPTSIGKLQKHGSSSNPDGSRSQTVHVFPPLVLAPPRVEWRFFKHGQQQPSHYVRNAATQVGNAPNEWRFSIICKRVAVFKTSRGKISHINALLTATHHKMFDLPPIIFCCEPPTQTYTGSSAHRLDCALAKVHTGTNARQSERTLSRLHSISAARWLNHTPERAYARPAFGPARS